jgi:hypothetical protein
MNLHMTTTTNILSVRSLRMMIDCELAIYREIVSEQRESMPNTIWRATQEEVETITNHSPRWSGEAVFRFLYES